MTDETKRETNLLRNGDITFRPVGEDSFGGKGLPPTAKKKLENLKSHPVAFGEVTGHSHMVRAVDPGAMLNVWEDNGTTFLEVYGGRAEIVHEEHFRPELKETRDLPAGIYEIGTEQEYDPFEEQRKTVID